MAGNDLIIEKEIIIQARRSTIYKAISTAEGIVQFFPYDEAELDPKVGGDIILSGVINGMPFTDYGHIDILDRSNSFQYSYWSENHGTPRTTENFVTIGYTLEQVSEGIKLTATQSNLPSEQYYEIMNPAWDQFLPLFKKEVEKNEQTLTH